MVQWCHGWLIKKRETRLRRKGLLPRPVQESVATLHSGPYKSRNGCKIIKKTKKTGIIVKRLEEQLLVSKTAQNISHSFILSSKCSKCCSKKLPRKYKVAQRLPGLIEICF